MGGVGLRISPVEGAVSLMKNPWERLEEQLARSSKRTIGLSQEFKSDGAIDRAEDHFEDSEYSQSQ